MKLKRLLDVKSFSLVITFGIILLLFLSGPTQAFVIGLDILNNEVDEGDIIGFIGEINIQSNEHLPIDYLELNLNGPETIICKFLSNGTVISGCKGITIKLIDVPNYGYSYGYGYGYSNGKLIYSFKLDTDNYNTGTYSTTLIIVMNNKTFSKTGNDIIINKKSSSSSSGRTRTIYKDKIIYEDKIKYVDKDCEDCEEPVTPEPEVITNTKIENKTPRWIKGLILLLMIGIGILSYFLVKIIKDNQLPDNEEDDELPDGFELEDSL